ncbi:MAG: hypothetical protein WC334_08345, partial [Kiritimatiellales bacterium]
MNRTLIAGLMVSLAFAAEAGTTIDAGHPYVYGANTGWINARSDVTNGAVIGRDYCSGWLWGANIGWVSLGDGAPLNHYAYANTENTDFGVNHDGAGRLRGYAWSSSAGWIVFEDRGNPHVDLSNGNLSGWLWGANIGWISLSNAQAFVRTGRVDPGPDTDGDGIPDPWEYRYLETTTTLAGGGADFDGDGVSDIEEYGMDTDPANSNDLLWVTLDEAGGVTNTLSWTTKPTRHYRLQFV